MTLPVHFEFGCSVAFPRLGLGQQPPPEITQKLAKNIENNISKTKINIHEKQ